MMSSTEDAELLEIEVRAHRRRIRRRRYRATCDCDLSRRMLTAAMTDELILELRYMQKGDIRQLRYDISVVPQL